MQALIGVRKLQSVCIYCSGSDKAECRPPGRQKGCATGLGVGSTNPGRQRPQHAALGRLVYSPTFPNNFDSRHSLSSSSRLISFNPVGLHSFVHNDLTGIHARTECCSANTTNSGRWLSGQAPRRQTLYSPRQYHPRDLRRPSRHLHCRHGTYFAIPNPITPFNIT
jgi:hypothetical protein